VEELVELTSTESIPRQDYVLAHASHNASYRFVYLYVVHQNATVARLIGFGKLDFEAQPPLRNRTDQVVRDRTLILVQEPDPRSQ
jgi:hypothetical protein